MCHQGNTAQTLRQVTILQILQGKEVGEEVYEIDGEAVGQVGSCGDVSLHSYRPLPAGVYRRDRALYFHHYYAHSTHD